MRDPADTFHLAIPVDDLTRAEAFYVAGLGCHRARCYPDRITVDFFGDQLVCHLSEEVDPYPTLYPRHFGVTFRSRADFDAVVRLAEARALCVFSPVSTRFEGRAEEHLTFVLRDPANNLIEFKHYLDHRMMH
jgi:extradiol dioxygenase family protein